MSVNPLRILLAEDDELFRLGLRMRLQQEPGFEVVAEAEDGEMAVEAAKQLALDIIILDIGLPGIGGIEACRQLKHLHADLPILVLTSRTQSSLVSRLIEAGAQGYCLKGIAPATLILAIRSIAAGASWWDAAATSEIRATFENQPPDVMANENPASPSLSPSHRVISASPLTRREQEILALIVTGKSNQDIAETLHITAGTVRVHVHAILHKLKVSDRAQAATVALQQQMIAQELLTDH
jgi:two-component system NarL family response regulator